MSTAGAFDGYIGNSQGANHNKTTLFDYLYEKNVVRVAMFSESLFLLPVALGHLLAPATSLQPMLRSGVKINGVASAITQWYGVNCLVISIFGILCSSAANNSTGYILRKSFYLFQLLGEGCVIPLFFMFIHKYGEWNFASFNYVFGTMLFSTLRIICLTAKPQWFGVKNDSTSKNS